MTVRPRAYISVGKGRWTFPHSVKRPRYGIPLPYAAMVQAAEGTMPDKVALVIFVTAMIALVVCGCVLTRKPTKAPKPKSIPPSAA